MIARLIVERLAVQSTESWEDSKLFCIRFAIKIVNESAR
jgi:hypothetical protein